MVLHNICNIISTFHKKRQKCIEKDNFNLCKTLIGYSNVVPILTNSSCSFTSFTYFRLFQELLLSYSGHLLYFFIHHSRKCRNLLFHKKGKISGYVYRRNLELIIRFQKLLHSWIAAFKLIFISRISC